MKVLYYDAVQSAPEVERELNATYVDKDRLLRDSDFISLHVLLSAETRHLIDERALRSMKKTAVLVNAARGPIVDEAALVKALSEKWIAAAGLDVFEEEPTIHPGLLPLTNVVMAPHIASASLDTRVAMSTLAVKNCLAVLEGKTPPTPVT
jgi:lactate dehydrogenase-like 2-hydroxyacid dehydrogenase